MVVNNLKSLGFSVDHASDGEIALECIKKKKYDLLVTDLKMPRMSGEILIAKVKELGLNHQKIIAISGGIINDYSKEQREMIKKSCDGY